MSIGSITTWILYKSHWMLRVGYGGDGEFLRENAIRKDKGYVGEALGLRVKVE